MWQLVGQLLPEMVGLAITPAAIVATFVLLTSSHPWRNVALLAGVFLAVYGAIVVVACVVGSSAGRSDQVNETVRGEVSIGLGAVFLAGGVVSWVRSRHRPRNTAQVPPVWLGRLVDPSARLVVGIGAVLSVVNPNVAILASGLSITLSADVTNTHQVIGIALLLGSSMLDFIVPTLAFALTGPAGRTRLRSITAWLIEHNQAIGTWVLIGFGLLFVARGLAVVLG